MKFDTQYLSMVNYPVLLVTYMLIIQLFMKFISILYNLTYYIANGLGREHIQLSVLSDKMIILLFINL